MIKVLYILPFLSLPFHVLSRHSTFLYYFPFLEGGSRVIQKEGEIHLELEVPGFDKKEIKLYTQEGVLFITAQQQESSSPKKGSTHVDYSRKIYKTFDLGRDVDVKSIKASLKNGILNIVMPIKKLDKDNAHIIHIN